MNNSIENAIISLYNDIFFKGTDNNTQDKRLLTLQDPLILFEEIRESYTAMQNKLIEAKENEELLRKTQDDQTKLIRELTSINETLKKNYNELKTSKNELKREYQEIEETNDYLSSELIQRSTKLKELQDNNEQLLQELSQVRYEFNSLHLKLEKSKSIKNIFGSHNTIIGYVEEEEITSVNPMSQS